MEYMNFLEGVIDLHIHTNPDIRQRRLNDIELAREAARVKARAIVIKSHLVPTMDRAAIAEHVVPGVRVFGGIVLNPYVGGLNKAAVDVALQLGAKFVWLPTSWSSHERKLQGKNDGVVCVEDNKVVPELIDILKLVAGKRAILATGHLAPDEIVIVVDTARKLGVEKILINHPEWWSISMSIDLQKELATYGVYFERCYANRFPGKDYQKNFFTNLEAIEKVGYESTVIATDGGQLENPIWSEALGEYIAFLHKEGISQSIIDVMTKKTPAKLLDLD